MNPAPWESDPIVQPAGGAPWEADPIVQPAEAQQPQTGMVEQTGSGINEGIAKALGLPVDTVASVLNMGARAMGLPQIERPIGGAESIKSAMGDRLISPVAPQTGPQRYARRIGQEVGAGAVMAPAMGVASIGGAALNTAADVGAGIGGQTAREIAPESDVADVVGSMAGGLGVVAAGRAMRPSPQAPTRAELKDTKRAAYDTVGSDTTRLSTAETRDLKQQIADAVTAAKIHPQRHPKASAMVDDLFKMHDPTLTELDQWRQVVSRDVAGAADESERRLGQIIKDTIDGYVDRIKPGTFSEDTVNALRAGREATGRIKRSDIVETAIEKGERRAATSGTGGNQINAIRQNIRAILDDPRKARGFSIEEREAMEGIVRGTRVTNAARLAGRFAPTAGAFPMAGTMVQAAAAGSSGNPLYAAPAIIGGIAKVIGEKLTERQVNRLSELIRNGGKLAAKDILTREEFNVFKATMAAITANDQSEGR